MWGEEVVHVDHRERRAGRTAQWPGWLPDDCRQAVQEGGIAAPWQHQRALAELAFAGRDCAICTSTASGKTLAYLLPVMAATGSRTPVLPASRRREPMTALTTHRRHTALYLAPTKALAHDQWRVCRELGPQGWPVATLDGDSDQSERRFARDQAGYVLTNPDMLHRSVLPNHSRWRSLLGGLRYVVVDEAHRYRGVFGAHVAQVLRRLRRLCWMYGADPVFILSSATATNAAEAGRRLVGVEEIAVVDQDFSPQPARDVVLWQPENSTTVDAARLVAGLADEGRQTICFVASRALAEVIAIHAQDQATGDAVIASYRSGYLPQDRRAIEAGLQDGSVRAVVATNALELGVDVSGMDAVVVVGYPGRLSALWQQAGRAGRAGHDALVVVLAREDPLDQYLFGHPELIFGRSVETTVLHPDNPYVMGPHLAAAAQESCLTPADRQFYGPQLTPVSDLLVSQHVLRRRGERLFWTRPERAVDAIDLRSMGGRGIDVIDRVTGRVIGVVDEKAGDRTVHPGAVYLHQGDAWLVDEYLPEEHQALVHRDLPGYWTQPQSTSTVHIVNETDRRRFGPGYVATGDVELTEQVIGYLRRDEISNEVWDSTVLEMPAHTMVTQACWFVVPDPVVGRLGLNSVALAGAAHGTEHTAIGILPAFAPCDRWDIGGVSSALMADTGACTIVIHDGQAGGAGFARTGYERAEQWWHATARRLAECPCEAGCPSCVVSPKCGNANQMLDKAAARLLSAEMDPLG
ncbi:MAG: DEAD/DEAH box helicase [Acidipropionibacterium sp.]|jgi:DEAD/DEAH box helicase domain-containing protein|nr:DEAD/DEAH box helicase [Acidipropionibacterium sp.]